MADSSLASLEKKLADASTSLNLQKQKIIEEKKSLKAYIESVSKEIVDQKDLLLSELDSYTEQQLRKVSTQKRRVETLQTQCKEKDNDLIVNELSIKIKKLSNDIDQKPNKSTSFIPSAQLASAGLRFGSLLCSSVPCTAVVGSVTTAHFQFIPAVESSPLKAELICVSADVSVDCTLRELDSGKYEVSFEPPFEGIYKLCVRVGGDQIKGSPFMVSVRKNVNRAINNIFRPWGVAVMGSGNVVVAEMEIRLLHIISALERKDITAIDAREVGAPYGVAVDGDSNVIATFLGIPRVVKYSPSGGTLAAVGSKGEGPGQFKGPIAVCVRSISKKVYVVDNLAHCVHILNSDLSFSSKFGSQGSENGQFNYPRDIAIDSTGHLYVVDEVNHRIQVFEADGTYLRQFGKKGSGDGELNLPVSICIDSQDTVYVGEDMNARISIFSKEGNFITSFGSKGTEEGQFDRPFGVAVHGGVLYVCDYGNNRVQLISLEAYI